MALKHAIEKEAVAKAKECQVHLWVPLFANPQAFHLVEPVQGALHHPAMASQTLLRLHASAGDAGNDVALP